MMTNALACASSNTNALCDPDASWGYCISSSAPVYCTEQTVDVQMMTNVVTADNEVRVPYADIWMTPVPVPGTVTSPATRKTEMTEAVEIKTLSFEWEGQTHTVEHRTILWTKVKRWVKSETWKLEE